MIARIVLLKLDKEFTTEDKRQEIAAYSRKALAAVPGVAGVEVGVPAEEKSAESWDLCLMIKFESMDVVPAYIKDPAHRAYVDEYLKPKVEFKKAWNFETA